MKSGVYCRATANTAGTAHAGCRVAGSVPKSESDPLDAFGQSALGKGCGAATGG